MFRALICLIKLLIKTFKTAFKSKQYIIMENLSLRQQLSMYKAKNIKPKINDIDRSFWIAIKQSWKNWINVLIVVKPETVINWQKNRFKNYWHKISSQYKRKGRPRIKKEIKNLIYKMATENYWGAPRIYSELLMLGYTKQDMSQQTVSRYLKKIRTNDPNKIKKQQSWKTFLNNNRDVIASMDFFVVPTISFNIIYVFFIIDHNKRKIIHFNLTINPTSQWVIQQIRNAFSFSFVTKYLIFDRDSIFAFKVKDFIKSIGIVPKTTSYQSPWQNEIAERWILSVRTELLNHVIILNEDHLYRLIKEYVSYYNNDRCHLSLSRDSPNGRKIQNKPSEYAKVISIPKLGGLQHKYEWRKAA